MAILLFIFFGHVAGIPQATEIERYASVEACEAAREYVMKEMEKAYPGDKEWTLKCYVPGEKV